MTVFIYHDVSKYSCLNVIFYFISINFKLRNPVLFSFKEATVLVPKRIVVIGTTKLKKWTEKDKKNDHRFTNGVGWLRWCVKYHHQIFSTTFGGFKRRGLFNGIFRLVNLLAKYLEKMMDPFAGIRFRNDLLKCLLILFLANTEFSLTAGGHKIVFNYWCTAIYLQLFIVCSTTYFNLKCLFCDVIILYQ